MTAIFVAVCTFKRSRRGQIEYGLAIGADESDIKLIVDQQGDKVGLIADYTIRAVRGCFTADLPAIAPKESSV